MYTVEETPIPRMLGMGPRVWLYYSHIAMQNSLIIDLWQTDIPTDTLEYQWNLQDAQRKLWQTDNSMY